jgi:hypothetical protein
MHAQRLLCGTAPLLAFLVCGCASTGFFKPGKEEYPKAGPKNPVVHVMAMWQPATGVGLDNRTCRGFAGQAFFVAAESPTPAQIDGDVSIYLFDDQGKPEERTKPIHIFQFEAKDWKNHARKGQLGVTYAVFIPYTRKGMHAANCSLMVSYTPRGGGPTLKSEMVNVDIPGTKAQTDEVGDEPATNSTATKPIEDQLAIKGRDLGRKIAEAAEQRELEARLQPREARRKAAADSAARHEIELSRTPRKLSPADEQRLIREARQRLAGEGHPADLDSEGDNGLRHKHRIRRNPLVDERGSDDSADLLIEPDSLTPGTSQRRNPLLDDDSDERQDDNVSVDQVDARKSRRISNPARSSRSIPSMADAGN